MRKILALHLLLCVGIFTAQAQFVSVVVPDSVFQHYQQLNANEQRLPEFKDNDSILRFKIEQLYIINKSRKKARLNPLTLNILACRFANQTAHEAAIHNYTGHWNLKGEKPYSRWSAIGGRAHISENAYGSVNYPDPTNNPAELRKQIQEAHTLFMKERPPNDGHRKNILTPAHNQVGIGFYFFEGRFRYYEEFLDNYLQIQVETDQVKSGEKVEIIITPPQGYCVFYAAIFHENLPKQLSPKQISARHGYPDFGTKKWKSIMPNHFLKYRNDSSAIIKFTPTRTGLYYVHMYITHCDHYPEGRWSTAGQSNLSGLVIRVEN